MEGSFVQPLCVWLVEPQEPCLGGSRAFVETLNSESSVCLGRDEMSAPGPAEDHQHWLGGGWAGRGAGVSPCGVRPLVSVRMGERPRSRVISVSPCVCETHAAFSASGPGDLTLSTRMPAHLSPH